MKIVLLNDFGSVRGGADQVALSEAAGLARRGHAVTALFAVGPVDPGLGSIPGLTVECLGKSDILQDPSRFRAMRVGVWDRAAADWVEWALQHHDPSTTIVHIHSWTKALSASVFQRLRRRGFNPVITVHDFFLACPNGTFHHHPENVVCRLAPLGWKCVGTQCDRRSYAHKLWRVARQVGQSWAGGVPKNIRHFITLSEASEAVIRPFLPAAAHCHRVTNPVPVSRQPRVDAAGNRQITFVGRLTGEKGVLDLAQASRSRTWPSDWRWLLAGDGELKGRLQREYPEIRLTGWLERDAVNACLSAARVLVFPSVWHETFGLTIAEALARGVPVIVSDSCAGRELVQHGVTGGHFRGGNVESLVEALEAVRSDAVVDEWSRAAHATYWERPMDLERHLTELEAVYARVLSVGG